MTKEPLAKLANIRALLCDVDNTIVRFKQSGEQTGNRTGSLFDVLRIAGVKLAGLTPDETMRRIQRVQRETKWWHWSDFIVELGLNAKRFWDFAYRVESKYLEATGPEILPALRRLRESGLLLYVASNNPSSGILHKLRVAGLGHITGATLFSQLLGATELHAMKWEPIYWKKVLAHIALDPAEVAIVGDNPRDDYEVPRSVGFALSFIIDRNRDLSAESTDSLLYVRDFSRIADLFSRGRR